jgi:hypothetical protein
MDNLVILRIGLLTIQALINRRNFLYPTTALGMFQVQDGLWRPVEVISNEGYLLVEHFEGVA